MKELKFEIYEPENKIFCTRIRLLNWEPTIKQKKLARDFHRNTPPMFEYVIQLHWFPWLYKRNIRKAKEKIAKRYEKFIAPDKSKTWIETR